MINELRYIITPLDMAFGKFPYAKVLQCKFKKTEIPQSFFLFKDWMQVYIKDRAWKYLTLEELNLDIYAKVYELQKIYPREFDAVGFYTKNMLAHLYQTNRICLDGIVLYPQELLAKELEEVEVLNEHKRILEANSRARVEAAIAQAKELAAYREKERIPVTLGMCFISKKNVFNAYAELFKEYGIKSDVGRVEFIKQYIEIDYGKHKVRNCWMVIDKFKEGGRAYVDEIL